MTRGRPPAPASRRAEPVFDFGQRVQLSVFECPVESAQWVALKNRLIKEIDPTTDSLRFYYLGGQLAAPGRARGRQAQPRTWRGRWWSEIRCEPEVYVPGREVRAMDEISGEEGCSVCRRDPAGCLAGIADGLREAQ